MQKKWLLNCSILALYLLSCFLIYHDNTNKKVEAKKSSISQQVYDTTKNKKEETENAVTNVGQDTKKEDAFATLSIPKIKLNRNIYSLKDKRNNVDENVTLLKGSKLSETNKNFILLAAHSGIGPKAIFTRLDELTLGDIVYFTYKDKKTTYQVDTIEEQEKNGSIKVPKQEENELILTTCSEQDKTKQLILLCTVKN